MELLYQKDSYLSKFSGTIIEIDIEKKTLIFDRSVFFPGGGGQPCDHGGIKIDGKEIEIVDVKRENNKNFHFIDGELPPVGSSFQGYIDWTRRYQLMRTHTSTHILSGVIWRDYKAHTTGGNMTPLKARLDFEFENLTRDMINRIEEKINIEIKKKREIKINFLSREDAFEIPNLIRTKTNLLPNDLKIIRTIDIVGLDLQADGGTHCSNTEEVGKLVISKYKSKGKINKRIEITIEDE